MLKGKTASGFSFSISEEARDDMELLENITKYDAGHRELLPDILVGLLGQAQKDKLYNHCRGKSGRVSATKVFEELQSMFGVIQQSNDDVKN